ncbi:protein of unknown function [Bradyrhizobium vignae]|uniref:DUF2225 domain-containing protein n=2 Tax=Bradyrhizobium vignae TaxID=1549949 RepID=A0A2U3PVC8_9BRAD|nr:protein of unknown function [Bradyrhizobium vignae]
MTNDRKSNVRCFCCGQTSEQSVLLSTNEIGSRDIDQPPSGMERFNMSVWLQECPTCGYVAPDISDGDDRDRLFVQTERYAALREGPHFSRRSSRFLLRAAIDVARDDFERASVNTLCAARDADDCALGEVASGLRKIASRYLVGRSVPSVNLRLMSLDALSWGCS